MPIAMDIDYGVLSRIYVPLEQPSDLEVVLMPAVRLYHMVAKDSSSDGKGGLKSIPRVKIPRRLKKPFPTTARGSLSLLSTGYRPVDDHMDCHGGHPHV